MLALSVGILAAILAPVRITCGRDIVGRLLCDHTGGLAIIQIGSYISVRLDYGTVGCIYVVCKVTLIPRGISDPSTMR